MLWERSRMARKRMGFLRKQRLLAVQHGFMCLLPVVGVYCTGEGRGKTGYQWMVRA